MNWTAGALLLTAAIALVAGVSMYSYRAAVIVAAVLLLLAGLGSLEARDRP